MENEKSDPLPREQAIQQLVTKAVADSLAATKDDTDELQWATNLIAHLTSAMLDHLLAEGQPPREHANFDGLVAKLTMEAVTGIKPLLPDASYGQDVALVAHLIDTLRQQLANALNVHQETYKQLLWQQERAEAAEATVEALRQQLAQAQQEKAGD